MVKLRRAMSSEDMRPLQIRLSNMHWEIGMWGPVNHAFRQAFLHGFVKGFLEESL